MYLFCLLILEYDVLFMMTSRICLSVEYNHEFLDITWPVGLLKNVSSVPFFFTLSVFLFHCYAASTMFAFAF